MLVRIDVAATVADLHRTEGEILAAVRQVVGQVAAFIADDARGTTKFKDQSGAARRSIHREATGEFSQRVVAGGPDAPQVLFLEEGTAAHPVDATNAQALRFVVDGQVMFRKHVDIPAFPALHFMADAAAKGEAVFPRFIEAGLNQVLGG